jgi:hypothetical protein
MRIKLNAASLFLAPLFYAMSSFFWNTKDLYGTYNAASGLLLIIGSIFWVLAFSVLFDMLKERMPNYASWGFLLAVYGCLCGGVAFALRDILMVMFNIPHHTMLTTLSQYPILTNIIFWIGGPAFPISLLILGIVMARTRAVPIWVGILIAVSGALFPASRIPRIEWIAHVVDLLLMIPLAYLAWEMFIAGDLKRFTQQQSV